MTFLNMRVYYYYISNRDQLVLWVFVIAFLYPRSSTIDFSYWVRYRLCRSRLFWGRGIFCPGLGQKHRPAFLAIVVTGGVNFTICLDWC